MNQTALNETTLIAQARASLHRAVGRAHLAPSIYNSQPWQFRIVENTLDICLDRTRRLPVIDPDGRQALISCGCALFNTRVSLAADTVDCTVERLPDGPDADVLARVRVSGKGSGQAGELAELDRTVPLRTTNRTRFTLTVLSEDLLTQLAAAAAAEGGIVVPIRLPDQRAALAVLSTQADRTQNADPAYRAEIRAWTTDDPARRDGVPASVVPHVDGHSGDEIPLRDFDSRGNGRLPARTASSRRQTLLLLGTQTDDPLSWLRAGEALERVLLQIARHGYAASPLNQVLEVPWTRYALRCELGIPFQPQFLLRVGYGAVTPSAPRRLVTDVLVDTDKNDS
jgi:nitroreductase